MNQFSLQKLIDLVEFDQGMVKIEHAIDKLKEEIAVAQKEADLCNEGLDRSKKNKHDLKKEVDATELEMKTLDQDEKEKRRRLDAATNQREYESFSKEVAALQVKQNSLEEELLLKWKKYEHAEVELKERQAFCDEKLISLNTVITEKMRAMDEQQKNLKHHHALREEKLKNIPQELLEKYNVMYKQVSNPVVPVEKESCTACFYPLTQQNMHDLRRRKLLQCRDCFRFLYLKEAHEEPKAG
jgi:predicted  nucleic acid-binding Zn-ribbon protein